MLSRRQFLKLGIATAASAVVSSNQMFSPLASAQEGVANYYLPFLRSQEPPTDRPNVLFIGIDDLNDWVGCLGGNQDAKTPNIDQLAQRGVLFERAYTAYPMCNASRAALMTGVAPSTSGIYSNKTYFRDSPILKDAVTLPQYFKQHGYYVTGAGKMYCSYPDPPSWNDYWPSMAVQHPPMPELPPGAFPLNGFSGQPFFDWGRLDVPKEEMDDWQVADKVIDLLSEDYDQPFFIACGFFETHQPWYTPPEYFARHQYAEISLPETLDNDLGDVPYIGKKLAIATGEHELVLAYHQWREAVQAYLASISFVDDNVGRVINALNNSAYRDNTLIVLWADHGWHLGEKQHWKKHTLWEESTRNILLFAGAGVETPGWRVESPVSLMDVYPTLVELCGLEPKSGLEGHSLYPMFGYHQYDWPYPAVTAVTSGEGTEVNFAVRSRQWRYIRYADGTEELYDHNKDENEWYNIANDAANKPIIQELAQWVPRDPARPILPQGLSSAQEYRLLND